MFSGNLTSTASLDVLLLFVGTALYAMSCEKEKTCKCTTSVHGEVLLEVKNTIEEGKCSDGGSEDNVMGVITKTTCVEQ